MIVIPENVLLELDGTDFNECNECTQRSANKNCDHGFIRTTDEKGYEIYKPCINYEKFLLNRRVKLANIPNVFYDAMFDLSSDVFGIFYRPCYDKDGNLIFKNSNKVDVNKFGAKFLRDIEGSLKQTPRKDSPSLLILGFVGSGKSYFSSACANGLIADGYNAYYIKASDYISEVKNYYDEESKEKVKFLQGGFSNESDNCHMLILDELGLEDTDNIKNVLYVKSLLRSRIEKRLTTIATTNLQMDDIKNIYDEDMLSMLLESYYIMFMGCEQDYRVKLNNNLYKGLDFDSIKKGDK